MQRTPGCLAKLDRMNRTLRHQEADRVPVSDSFWGAFLKRWREELGLAHDADIYRCYDLDWMVTVPNMDPHIRQFEILAVNRDEVVVRTGFDAVIRKKFDQAMPAFLRFETDTLDQLEAFQFDDAWDERRFFRSGDNQLAGVGDGFERNSPAWIETVKTRRPGIPVYGSVCEAQEMLWRIVGSENVLLWIGEAPDRLGRSIDRVARFCLDLARAQMGCWTAWSSGATWPTRKDCCSPPTTGGGTSNPA
jgi:uroporphyrinogen decarboxylase